MLLTTKILLTIVTLGYSLVPTLFDLGMGPNSHATEPFLGDNARVRLAWQMLSYNLIAVVALYLIWTAGPNRHLLRVPALLGLSIYASLGIASANHSLYQAMF